MSQKIRQLELCSREMFGDLILTCQTPHFNSSKKPNMIQAIPVSLPTKPTLVECHHPKSRDFSQHERERASSLVEELLVDIYSNYYSSDYNSSNSTRSCRSRRSLREDGAKLETKDVPELIAVVSYLSFHVERVGSILVRQLKRRDALRRQQDAHCGVITGQLRQRNSSDSGAEMRFTINPTPGESGFSQWSAAMKMVAQLSGGIPAEFRRRLWLTLAEKHLNARRIDWASVEKNCFSEWSHPADSELGVQIVKDLHRTGCSLFCGKDGQENQALLKRVLLAYARWNKAVGYCQGFNMLAALILQVTEKCETDALKLMIYLIEGVLPDSYFADSLRGLSVDMAVFRELLRSRLPRLSKHLDLLQNAAKDGTTSYEPPLTNVFTMQWFLTLFCNCLPHNTVLRVWDLILLEGNEILLRTALAIWKHLSERILTVRSADEFYCLMGALTRELLEFELIEANFLIKTVVTIGPLTELKSLREHYLYNINPWGTSVPLLPPNLDKQIKVYAKDRLVLDISALKKQYVKLKQRQRQAHIIFSAAISRQPPSRAPVAMNHLLLGKSALVPVKRLGPPKGSIPPARTLHWKDAPKTASDSSSSSDTELCDDDDSSSTGDEQPPGDNLMSKDNKPSEEVLVEAPIFDTASTSVNLFHESDDDSGDFEKFLEDRVRCLKEIKEEDGENRLKYARRNSERALQIIQENSLILHRIMQCQSRLSPPFVEPNNGDGTTEDETSSTHDTLLTQVLVLDAKKDDDNNQNHENQSPEYGSKYSKIIEKSRDLDERYNNLILNANVNLRSVKTDSFDHLSDSYRIPKLDSCGITPEEPVPDGGLTSLSLEEGPSSSLSPLSEDKFLKSPNKVFNPFPIPLSSRQNKEVPLKLGLYKK